MGIPKESVDLVERRADELKRLIPEAFTEGKLDLNKLKEALGDLVEASGERYSFNWAGRIQSLRTRDRRSKGTLVPSKKESVAFDETSNIFIEGENLEVLKILQKSYEGKIKMIYIDPPYNTGNDFVYKDDFSDNLKSYLKYTGQINGNGEKTTTDTETSGRYHSNWLSMVYPRLFLARNLLGEDGLIFVSIDDNEVYNLRLIMNEIFGEENFVAQIVWENKEGGGGSDSRYFKIKHEYALVYAKSLESAQINGIDITNEDRYTETDEYESRRGKHVLIKLNSASIQYSDKLDYPIEAPDGTKILPSYGGKKACWRWSRKKVDWGLKNGFVVIKRDKNNEWAVYTKMYLKVDNEDNPIERTMRPIAVVPSFSTTQASNKLENLFGKRIFEYSKPYELIKFFIELATRPEQEDIILDFFAGSATTAQAVLTQNNDGGNRKFILVQLPELTPEHSEAKKAGYNNIAEIAKERMRRVIKNIKEAKTQGEASDLGFKVFKLSKSNCFVWDSDDVKEPNTLAKHIEESAKGAKNADRDALIYELMLREGFALDSKIEVEKHGKNALYKVSDGKSSVWMCFDDHLDDEAARKLALTKDDKLIVLDSSLTDTQKVNLARAFRVETI